MRSPLRLARVPFRPLKRAAHSVRDRLFRELLRRESAHAALNALDGRLSYRRRRQLRNLIVDAYRTDQTLPPIRRWRVRFAGKTVDFQPGPDLPFTMALGIVGQDATVKAEYAALLDRDRPSLFLDVGANIGLDTIAMRMHGVETISFEPNLRCVPRLEGFAKAAGVTVRVEVVALGDQPGEAVLAFPAGQTYLGSIDPVVQGELQGELVRQSTPVRLLDNYFAPALGSVLIKIDTEGNELAVLRGAERFLAEPRTTVIFESLPGHPSRPALYRLLSAGGYAIRVAGRHRRLDEASFLAERQETNFIAGRR